MRFVEILTELASLVCLARRFAQAMGECALGPSRRLPQHSDSRGPSDRVFRPTPGARFDVIPRLPSPSKGSVERSKRQADASSVQCRARKTRRICRLPLVSDQRVPRNTGRLAGQLAPALVLRAGRPTRTLLSPTQGRPHTRGVFPPFGPSSAQRAALQRDGPPASSISLSDRPHARKRPAAMTSPFPSALISRS